MSYLISLAESDNQKIYKLKFGINKIGRNSDNNVIVEDEIMSRYHAEIKVTETEVILKDCNSKNQTYLNGKPIKIARVKTGDSIKFGHKNFKFTSDINPQEESFDQTDSPKKTVTRISLPENQSLIELISAQKAKLSSVNSEKRALHKLKILLEVSQELCSPQNPKEMLSKILILLFQIMDIDRAVILLADEKTHELKPKAVKLKEGIEKDQKFYSTKITESVFNKGEAILTSDAIADNRFKNAQSVRLSSVHASICVPLKTNNRVIGVLYIDNLFLVSVYSDEDVDFLLGLANQAAAAINMANEFYKREQKLKQEIRQLKITIDQNKKEQEVAEIIASDRFKYLEEKARKIRKNLALLD